MWFTAFNTRVRFYFAWSFANLICNSSGFGFSGYDAISGKLKWDLLKNFDLKNIEVILHLLVVKKNFFIFWFLHS
jgi:hypothetical protein